MGEILSLPLRLLLSAFGLGVSFMPRWAELWLGPKLGRLVLATGVFRWRIAYDNIRHCFPELGEKGWKDLLKRNYEHYGILFFEFLHFFSPLPGHYRRYAERISRLEGFEHFKKAHDKGNGVIFFSCHVGFWEMVAAAGGMAGFVPTVATTVLKPRWLHEKIAACRLSTGVRSAYHPGSGPTLLRALRRGESIAFMNDQYASPPMGIAVPFFGVSVNTLAAVAPLARRTGAAVVPVSGYRDDSGIMRIIAEPELELGAALESVEKTTEILAAKVESWVRMHPAQWLWIHRRFKHVTWPEQQKNKLVPVTSG